MHLNLFPKPYHNAYPFDPKDGTHPLLFTESGHSRELTDEAFHRRQHVFRITKVARQGTQLYGQVKQEQVVKR